MPDLFDDVQEAPSEVPQPAQATPPGVLDKVRWKWATMSGKAKLGVAALVVVGLLALWGALGGGGKGSDKSSESTSTMSKTATSVAPTTTVPPQRLVRLAKDRPRTDPFRQLPDLHPMVYAYAGNDGAAFSNVVNTLISAGASMCSLYFGVDDLGWRVVPGTPDTPYPNDFFPVRVFVSAPCAPQAGNPDPQSFIQPATPTTVAH